MRASLFLFFGGCLMLLAASLRAEDIYFSWAGITFLLLAFYVSPGPLVPLNFLSTSVALFCAWLLASAAWFTPHYLANGFYRPLALFGGFAVAARLDRSTLEKLFRWTAMLLALLVFVGLLQTFFGFWNFDPESRRAAATFATPNTFATVINLVLLPIAALSLSGRGGWNGTLAVFWLFAGLMSTESRGGWVAFIFGLVFIAIYAGLPMKRELQQRWKRLLFGLAGVVIAYYMMKLLAVSTDESSAGRSSLVGMLSEDIAGRGFSFRTELAGVALRLIAERPWLGSGANTFWSLYEMTKPSALDIGMTFPFVHNDYLQTWVEFGLLGVGLLFAIVAATSATLLKAWPQVRNDAVITACGAALASIFVHALVDFPLYVPLPLAIMGALLGVLAVQAGEAGCGRKIHPPAIDVLRFVRAPLVSGALTIALIAWIGQPALADIAASRALAELIAGRGGEGLYWQSVARRLEPAYGRRYWEEGIIMRDQAIESNDSARADKADALFAEGMRVDPYDVNNFVERARLHRTQQQLLTQRATPDELLSWSAHVLKVRPYLPASQAEYARALNNAGRTEEARRLARTIIERHPESQVARRLAAELSSK